MTLPILHHVGFVVASIEQSRDGFLATLRDARCTETVEDPSQRVKVAFLISPGGGAQVELVEPVGPKSPVQKFLDHGGGFHHVCYEIECLEQELSRQKALGATVIRSPRPAVAFNGRRIAWIVSREKMLIEFLESDSTSIINPDVG